jgi:hypothetical protein
MRDLQLFPSIFALEPWNRTSDDDIRSNRHWDCQKSILLSGRQGAQKFYFLLLIQGWEREATLVSDRTSDDESVIAAVSHKSNIWARSRGQIRWQRVT